MRYFPLFLDLEDRKAVVVGGGEEALRKVRLLLKTEGAIEIIAPELHAELADLADRRPHRLDRPKASLRAISMARASSMLPTTQP